MSPGLLQNILGGNNQAPRSLPFRSSVQIVSGDAAPVAYNTVAALIAFITGAAHAAFIKIWEMTVPAQQRIHWGFGSPGLPHNQGYMWFAALLPGTDFDVGVLRLRQANARETKIYVIAEIPDSALHTADSTTLITATPGNRNEMIALPEKVEFPLVREDSLLQLTYALHTASAGHTAAGFVIPITVYQ